MLLFVWCAASEDSEDARWIPRGELSHGMRSLIASDGEAIEETRNGTVYHVQGTLYMVTR